MKKILSILLILTMMLAVAAATADTLIDATGERDITIQPAGTNEVGDAMSPTTGRDLSEVDLPVGFTGMAATGTYYPVLVQHNGYASGLGNAAPWFGSYADVFYEMAKSSTGHTRLTMLFNDVYPEYVGGSRSIRVGHFFLQQEWGAPYLFHGMQEGTFSSEYNTDVEAVAREYGVPRPGSTSVPYDQHVLLDGRASKPWSEWRYRVKGLPNACNVVWNLQKVVEGLVQDREFPDHAWKFSETLPEGGDSAENIYVIFNNEAYKQGNEEDGAYYFNSMLQYAADENVYYRYLLKDKDNYDNAELFDELAPTGITPVKEKGENKLTASLVHGNPITFSNVIIQFVRTEWTSGETPYTVMMGSGNADFFMGGKHYAGVWSRDGINSRTVYYGADGQEISLQPGKTLVVLMDSNVARREVRYE